VMEDTELSEGTIDALQKETTMITWSQTLEHDCVFASILLVLFVVLFFREQPWWHAYIYICIYICICIYMHMYIYIYTYIYDDHTSMAIYVHVLHLCEGSQGHR
jgi:hypothetical protein